MKTATTLISTTLPIKNNYN